MLLMGRRGSLLRFTITIENAKNTVYKWIFGIAKRREV